MVHTGRVNQRLTGIPDWNASAGVQYVLVRRR